jgi:hypothetical protein
MELTKYERELKDRSEKIVDDLASLVNSMSFKPDYFIEAMGREHRTLQQSFTKLCLQWIEYVGHNGYPHDGRNEASHQVCHGIVKLFVCLLENKSNALPSQMLPLI